MCYMRLPVFCLQVKDMYFASEKYSNPDAVCQPGTPGVLRAIFHVRIVVRLQVRT